MRVLITGVDFKPMIGGIAEYTHQIAYHLHMAGDKVIILAKKLDNAKDFDSSVPYKIYRDDFEFIKKSKIKRFRYGFKYFRNFLKNHSIDVIINNSYSKLSIIACAVANYLRIPFAIFSHGLEVNVKELSIRLRMMPTFRRADRVICISSFTQSLVMRNFGVSQEKTVVIPGGVSLDDFVFGRSKRSSPITKKFNLENKRVIYTFGRVVERKGHDVVIEALPLILKEVPNLVYLIGGTGIYESKLRQLVSRYGLEKHVIFAGEVKEKERQAYYDACDLFIMPCRQLENGDVEGFGIVFSEANACGKPVIAGKSGGAVDAVIHHKTGLLVDPLNVNEIAYSVIYLLKSPEIAKKMGENGRHRVEEELSWQTLGKKMRSELVKIAERRHK